MSTMTASEASSKTPRELARETTYQTLQTWIVEGQLAGGEIVRDQDLATRLGVSRTPVREALRRLADEGLVEMAAQRWTRIVPVASEAANRLYPLISTLESLAALSAVGAPDPEQIAALRAANTALRTAIRVRDAFAAVRADDDFHRVIVDMARNDDLTRILAPLKVQLRRLELAHFREALLAVESAQAHDDIIAAIEEGAPALAARLIADNWTVGTRRFVARVEKA
jgi:DNA-binding GntR family transcriptional regulator